MNLKKMILIKDNHRRIIRDTEVDTDDLKKKILKGAKVEVEAKSLKRST